MLPSPEEARAFPRGSIDLRVCESCGFVANRSFDPQKTEYSERYEPTQGWSATFRSFHRDLATRLAARVPLAGRKVVEIGCGQGEFLHLLCGQTGATGLGFDPAVDDRRSDVVSEQAGNVDLVADFFSEETAQSLRADFLVCKMTLEHIPAPDNFAALCARVARNSAPGMRLFIQVPDSLRILRDVAFEDIYYEHCCYFTGTALAALFARHGFRADEMFSEFDGQYLGLLATFTGEQVRPPPPDEVVEVLGLARDFACRYPPKVEAWRRQVVAGGRVVIWGSGSKGVTFLHALGDVAQGVTHVVDINPHRQGMFMVGSGHPIVAPRALHDVRPDTVIVMNPVYRDEVASALRDLGIEARLLTLD
ncbi:MAG TPA: class I SAM-dependent methyltransferase [Acetobacteraceae bacterium]|nr:class I SAM-dependent methyltransferase [Acetobacteraceae bacterium]